MMNTPSYRQEAVNRLLPCACPGPWARINAATFKDTYILSRLQTDARQRDHNDPSFLNTLFKLGSSEGKVYTSFASKPDRRQLTSAIGIPAAPNYIALRLSTDSRRRPKLMIKR
eukprot:scaffold7025_cov225-Skeletonema_marinoi.AAC.3